MSGYAEYDLEKTPVKENNVYNVPVVIATPESLGILGRLIDNFEQEECKVVPWPRGSHQRPLMKNTGVGANTYEDFIVWWEGSHVHGENKAVNSGRYTTGIVHPGKSDTLLVREMNYHPDGEQLIFPKQIEPFIVVMGIPGDEISYADTKTVQRNGQQTVKFIAYWFDGTKGLVIHPNVWHQPPIPLTPKQIFLDKQAQTHACVGYDSLKEHKLWLGVHLHGLNLGGEV